MADRELEVIERILVDLDSLESPGSSLRALNYCTQRIMFNIQSEGENLRHLVQDQGQQEQPTLFTLPSQGRPSNV